MCHVCSEIRDIYKKTGAWFYKGLPKFDLEYHRTSDERKVLNEERQKSFKASKTTKLGMEIESEEEDEEGGVGCGVGDDGKSLRSGSVSISKSKNILGLHLTATDSSCASKKSPVSPYSRQTSSSDSQKSAQSLQPNLNVEWEMPPVTVTNQNGSATRQQQHRRSSISSCFSIAESLSHHELAALNLSERESLFL